MQLPCKDNSASLPCKISVGTLPVQLNKTGDWRFLTPFRREKTSPCTAACPLHSGIAEWTEKISQGDWQGAWESVSRYNPFPAITGHVCYHFCEESCTRGTFDQPLAVSFLERELGAWRWRQFYGRQASACAARFRAPLRVAIAGSGPAGLASAFYLAMLGVEVTIYEREQTAGGMLALGIPEYRLPRPILEQELTMLRAMGVVFRCGVEVGRHITLDQLQNEYQAVFLATGAGKDKKLSIAREELPGVIGAVEFLTSIHLGRHLPAAKSVVVIGGGNAAVDAACVARKKGAEVLLAYRRTRDSMPAHEIEIRAAEEAGVKFIFQVQPDSLLGRDHVEGLKLVRTGASRRGEALSAVEGSAFAVECDMLIVAAGQEPDFIHAKELNIQSGNSLTGLAGVFAGGDLAAGPGNVALAIAAGREAARDMAAYLEIDRQGENGQVFAPPFDADAPVVQSRSLNTFLTQRQGRVAAPEQEAGRCLACGKCNKCGICWLLCPDLAVDPYELNFLMDYCKGCGICAKECPGGVLEMEVAGDEAGSNNR